MQDRDKKTSFHAPAFRASPGKFRVAPERPREPPKPLRTVSAAPTAHDFSNAAFSVSSIWGTSQLGARLREENRA
jgi:hypothetical protein